MMNAIQFTFLLFFSSEICMNMLRVKKHTLRAQDLPMQKQELEQARSSSTKTPKIFHQQTRFQTQFPEQYHDASNSFSLLEALLVVARNKNKSKRRYYLSCSARVIYGHELFAFRNRNINRFEYLFQQRNAIKALCEHSHSSGC